MSIAKKILVEREGFVIVENLIPHKLIDDVCLRLNELKPIRASSKTKIYAERDEINKLPDISVWWSQMVMDWPEVIAIEKIIRPYMSALEQPNFYASDIVTIEKHSQWINPHVDTPHRFAEYNFDRRLLGIQCIVPLCDLDKDSGVTGLVPNSQSVDFEIHMCYKGYYNEWFMQRVVQPKLPKGSLLFYNCRVLHSSMPNPKDESRPALLLNYLEGSIVEDIKSVDNIWTSNGNQ
jgi:ectoine hydroxylase-related dioxygenase (phytanoyl-CoA dioxygenase family)